MPVYDMFCDDCGLGFEHKQRIDEDLPTKCPICEQDTLYQVYSISYVAVKGEPTTIGQLASRNASKMGPIEREAREQELNKNKPKERGPWYNPSNANLVQELKGLNTKEKRMKYIMEGKK